MSACCSHVICVCSASLCFSITPFPHVHAHVTLDLSHALRGRGLEIFILCEASVLMVGHTLQYGGFKMAHPSDRWASKILALPVFSDDFAQAILASQYSNLALIAAMEVRSAPEFVVQVHE